MQHSYHTLEGVAEGFYKEKGSKFFAYAYPVESEGEVKEYMETLKKKHFDARHHCYAFVLFDNPEVIRASDAGEPSNSAGQPILRQIRSFGLTNTLVAVVRYFGGTKLGVSGLVRAYRETVISFDPQHIHQAMQLVQSCAATVVGEDFTDGKSVYRLKVPLANVPSYQEALVTHYQIKEATG
jgi:putative IMPACT (imprinted ancient) family translation regulator